MSNRRVRAMAGVYRGRVVESEQNASDRSHQDIVVAARQVGAPDRSGEQRIAYEEMRTDLTLLPRLKTDAAWAVTWRVMRQDHVVSKTNQAPVVEDVDGRGLPDRQAEHSPLLDGVLVQRQVAFVEMDRGVQRVLDECNARDVIDVRVRQQDVHHLETVIPNRIEQCVSFVTRIDDDGVARAFAADNEPVLAKRWDGPDFEDHSTTIVST